MSARVRITRPDGRSITMEVAGADTPNDAANHLADFIRPDVFFSDEHHPHNDTVAALLEDARATAAADLLTAQERLRVFSNETAGL